MPQVTIDFTDSEWASMKAHLAQQDDDTDAKKAARATAWVVTNAKINARQCVDVVERVPRFKALGLSIQSGLTDDQLSVLEADAAAKAVAAP